MKTTASTLFQYLESIAPLSLQEKYDNSGVLIGNSNVEVSGVLICLDCTEEVIDECIRLGCNVIISHHPAIFYGLKQITGSNLTERLVMKAIRNDIILYAIHTNLDNTLEHGVNERFAKLLELDIEGTLRSMSHDPGNRKLGAGVIGTYKEAKTEAGFLAFVKEKMKAIVVRHSALLGKPISKVAVCGGSGSFLLEDAVKAGAQVLVTSDMKYHGFFDADNRIIICDIGHYESEQDTVNLLQDVISRKFSTFAAHCTQINTNPVHYFT